MALNPPTPGLTATQSGLRRIFYDARSAAKVDLVVQPGDELEVSDDIAAQLLKSSAQFKTEKPAESPPVVDEGTEEEPEQPAKNGTKKAWADYAVAKGADPDEVADLGRDDLVELYGG